MIEAAAPPRWRSVSFEALSGGGPVVVLAPHPDDESLGCGALLAQAFAGPGGHVVCMTDGSASHPGSAVFPPERLAARRAAELDEAVRALGGGPRDITRLGLPDARMLDLAPRYDRIARRVADLLLRLQARLLVTTAATDPHCDHIATAEIGRRAAERTGIRRLVYPIWSRWADPAFRDRLGAVEEFRLDGAGTRHRKARAIAAHATQHGQVITDDAGGFVLPRAFTAMFLDTEELYFDCGAR